MSSEDRLTRIENMIQSLTEHQIKNQIEIENLSGTVDSLAGTVGSLASTVQQVVVSVGRIADFQERTEERLLTLIEHVDGIEGRVKRLERSKS